MHEQWRALLYPLGFIASFIFGARFILQWLRSEKLGKSSVSSSFWKVSLMGNGLMALHTFIQVQYFLCIIQTCNAILSWRNLNLMRPLDQRKSIAFTFTLLISALLLPTLAFTIEGYLLYGEVDWVRTPTVPWSDHSGIPLPLAWHLLGFLGTLIFSLRFWLQWWSSEKLQKSYLGLTFWWVSLCGAMLALVYFIRLGDWVNILGYGVGIIPYARNLMLLRKAKHSESY